MYVSCVPIRFRGSFHASPEMVGNSFCGNFSLARIFSVRAVSLSGPIRGSVAAVQATSTSGAGRYLCYGLHGLVLTWYCSTHTVNVMRHFMELDLATSQVPGRESTFSTLVAALIHVGSVWPLLYVPLLLVVVFQFAPCIIVLSAPCVSWFLCFFGAPMRLKKLGGAMPCFPLQNCRIKVRRRAHKPYASLIARRRPQKA